MARSGAHTMEPRILVIDDDEPSCRLVKAIFHAEQIEVVAAHDGVAGLEAVVRERPDVVLLDLHMPHMDGMAALERLKDEAPAVPIIMLTGSRDVKDAVRAIKLGAFDYLTK